VPCAAFPTTLVHMHADTNPNLGPSQIREELEQGVPKTRADAYHRGESPDPTPYPA
jgi:hypothetical protein